MEAVEEQIAWTSIYSHPVRGPMFLEAGACGGLRCTSIVRSGDSFLLRRTKLRDGKYVQFEENGAPKMQLTFSCRLCPRFCPTITLDWKSELEVWMDIDTGIMLDKVSAASKYRFTQMYPIFERDSDISSWR